jgi:oxaloacetate decarboxylase (Na+ extruding) subunit alpha
MVTPLSQYVCAQATINVVIGERYKQVIDQVIQYALGFWGREAPEVMDPDVKDKILSLPRAREWGRWKPPQPTLAEVRRKFPAGISDEELILRVFAGDEPVNALQNGDRPRPVLNGNALILGLIEEIGKCKRCNYVYISRPDFSLKLERRSSVQQ